MYVIVLTFRAGQDYRGHAVALPIQGAQNLEAIALRHKQIQQQHLWMMVLHQAQRLFAIGGRADHIEVGLGLQQGGQRLAQDRMIVGNDYRNLVAHSHQLRCRPGHAGVRRWKENLREL